MKFYSETLDKLFDDEPALKAAEKAEAERVAAKKAASEAKKQDASLVEEAFKLRNAAKKEYNEKSRQLRKQYDEDRLKLRAEFEQALAEARNTLSEAEKAYDTSLKDFLAKHPEGYHMTLKDGDNVVTIDSSRGATNLQKVEQLLNRRDDWITDLFEELFNL